MSELENYRSVRQVSVGKWEVKGHDSILLIQIHTSGTSYRDTRDKYKDLDEDDYETSSK